MDRMKPYAVVIVIQLVKTGMFIITKEALDFGLDPFVFVFYRQAIGTTLLVSLSIILKRYQKGAPPLTFKILFKMFMLALIGVTLTFDIYHLAMKYTSETVAALGSNSMPVITFVLAILFGIETLKIKSRPGIAKVLGISFCVAGIMTITFYKGPQLGSLNHHNHHHVSHNNEPSHPTKTWIKGSFLMISSCVSWSLWLILQGILMKEYPFKLIFITILCIFSTIQTFIVAVAFQRDFSKWKLHWDMGLLGVAYSGFLVTGLSFYLQSWCIEKKGPVFLAMFTPLASVFTIISSSFILGKKINLGSVLGGVLMIGGLYSVLWGKSIENKVLDHHPCPEERSKVISAHMEEGK